MIWLLLTLTCSLKAVQGNTEYFTRYTDQWLKFNFTPPTSQQQITNVYFQSDFGIREIQKVFHLSLHDNKVLYFAGFTGTRYYPELCQLDVGWARPQHQGKWFQTFGLGYNQFHKGYDHHIARAYHVTVKRRHWTFYHNASAPLGHSLLLNVSKGNPVHVRWFDPRGEEVAARGPKIDFDDPNFHLHHNGSLTIKKLHRTGNYTLKTAYNYEDNTDIFTVRAEPTKVTNQNSSCKQCSSGVTYAVTYNITLQEGKRLRLIFENHTCNLSTSYMLTKMLPSVQILAFNESGKCQVNNHKHIRCLTHRCGFGFGRSKLTYTGLYAIVATHKTVFFNVKILPKNTTVHGAEHLHRQKRSFILWKNDHRKQDAREKINVNITAGEPFNLTFPQDWSEINHFHYERPGKPSHELAIWNPFRNLFEGYGFEVKYHQGTLMFSSSFPGMSGLYYMSVGWSTTVVRLYNVSIFRPHLHFNHPTIYANLQDPVWLDVSNNSARLVQWFDPRGEEIAEKGPHTLFDEPNFDLRNNGSLLIKNLKRLGQYVCTRAFLRHDQTDSFTISTPKNRMKRQAENQPTQTIDFVSHTKHFPNFIKNSWQQTKIGEEVFVLPLKYREGENISSFMWYKQQAPGSKKFYQINDFKRTLKNRDQDYDGDFDGSLNFTASPKTIGSYLLFREYKSSNEVIIVNHTISTKPKPARIPTEPFNTLGSDELDLLKSDKYLLNRSAVLLFPRNTSLTARCSYRWYHFSEPFSMTKLARQNSTFNKTYTSYASVTELGLMVHESCGRYLLLYRCMHNFWNNRNRTLMDKLFHFHVPCLPQDTFETHLNGRKLLARDDPYEEPEDTSSPPNLNHLVFTSDPNFSENLYYSDGDYFTISPDEYPETTTNISQEFQTFNMSHEIEANFTTNFLVFNNSNLTTQAPESASTHQRNHWSVLAVLIVLLVIIIICQCIWIYKHHRSYNVVPVAEIQL